MVKLSLDFYDLEAIEAESERVRAILVKIESELDPELERLFLEHAQMLKALAQTYVKVDTGSLQKTIRVEYIYALTPRESREKKRKRTPHLKTTGVQIPAGPPRPRTRGGMLIVYISKHHVAVRAGGYGIINPKTRKVVNYQTIIEAKYPFLRPAYEQVLPMLDQRIDDLMRRLTT